MMIVFDFDGVLVDSASIVRSILNEFLEGCGVAGVSEEAYFRLFDDNFYVSIQAHGVTSAMLPKLMQFLREGVLARKQGLPVNEGALEVLVRLSNQYTISIVTSNMREVVDAVLVKRGVVVSTLLCAEDGLSKREKFARLAGAQWYVTDTLGDIEEAHAAGLKVVAVTWGYHDRERLGLGNPEVVVDVPEQLLRVKW